MLSCDPPEVVFEHVVEGQVCGVCGCMGRLRRLCGLCVGCAVSSARTATPSSAADVDGHPAVQNPNRRGARLSPVVS